jgi:hypothetical protein
MRTPFNGKSKSNVQPIHAKFQRSIVPKKHLREGLWYLTFRSCTLFFGGMKGHLHGRIDISFERLEFRDTRTSILLQDEISVLIAITVSGQFKDEELVIYLM